MSKISQLREMIDLREVVAETRVIHDRGDFSMALCPFHPDKNPSLRIERCRYHCFGCGAHGDIIEWLKQERGLSFNEALEEACVIADLPIYSPQSRFASFDMPPAPDVAERVEKCRQILPCRELIKVLLLNVAGKLVRYATIEPKLEVNEIKLLCEFYAIPYTWEGKLFALRAWEELCEDHGID